ncbi:hypothetical protein N431DRAFT_475894 [Stipitochalara longipes BDJ]|nr:hypothetical protein N431DRAFT_475894 [Stipitochalara longipes BDJ]
MEGFPKLAPAFTIRMQTAPQLIMGPAFSNAVMAVGPIEHGTVKSVPGYGPEPFEGEIVNGADIFQVDALFRSVKLDFRAVINKANSEIVINRTPEGHAVYFTFLGFIEGNEDTALILKGDPNAKSSQWGSSFMSGTFETGNPKWAGITNKVYVGSQRLIKTPDKPLMVEINLSEVIV